MLWKIRISCKRCNDAVREEQTSISKQFSIRCEVYPPNSTSYLSTVLASTFHSPFRGRLSCRTRRLATLLSSHLSMMSWSKSNWITNSMTRQIYIIANTRNFCFSRYKPRSLLLKEEKLIDRVSQWSKSASTVKTRQTCSREINAFALSGSFFWWKCGLPLAQTFSRALQSRSIRDSKELF